MLISFSYLWEKYKIKCNGIIHLGGSLGQERNTYQQLGVPKVVWVEAIPSVFNELKNNIKNYDGHIAINECVGQFDGEEKEFFISNNEAQSSSYLPLGTHKEAHPEVVYVDSFIAKTKTLKTILIENGINIEPGSGWMLCADLQGSEIYALKGLGDDIRKFDWLYLEVNEKPLYEGCALRNELEYYLAQYGFLPKEEMIYKQWGWGDVFYSK